MDKNLPTADTQQALHFAQMRSKSLLKGWMLGKGYLKALKAMAIAESLHTGFRRDGTAEFSHQVFLAQQVRVFEASLIRPEESLILAFLHDTIEDYDVDPDVIIAPLGQSVYQQVRLLSKEDKHTSVKVSDLAAYFSDMLESPSVTVVKGFDRFHNIITMKGAFTPEKMRKYIDEWSDYIEPMLKTASGLFPEQENVYRKIRLDISAIVEGYEMVLSLLPKEG